MNIIAIWPELGSALNTIFNTRQILGRQRYMELYDRVYKYVEPKQDGSHHMAGQRLYDRLKEFFKDHLTELQTNGCPNPCDVTTFLSSVYPERWEKYQRSSKMIDGICAYLNRQWVEAELDEGREDIYKCYQLAMVLWHMYILEPRNEEITNAILQMVEQERNGNPVDLRVVYGVINSYFESNDDTFKEKFFEQTEKFYEHQSAEIVIGSNVNGYMTYVEARLIEEENQAQKIINCGIRKRLIKTCERMLIENHLELFRIEFQSLLETDMDAGLRRVASLVARSSAGLAELMKVLETHIQNHGLDALTRYTNAALSDSKIYVQTILGVYRKYHNLIRTISHINSGFMTALDTACFNFINTNAVTEASNNANYSSEVLTGYCTQLLKDLVQNLDGTDLKDTLHQVKIISKFVKDKNVFQNFDSYMLHEILRMVERERNGDTIGFNAVRNMIKCYVELGTIEEDRKHLFEVKFLEDTEMFYGQFSEDFLTNNSVVEYMRRVELLLIEEQKRGQEYLTWDNEDRLIKTCEKVLIGCHFERLRDEFQRVLESNEICDIRRMYDLVTPVENGVKELSMIFQSYVQNQGLSALSTYANNAVNDTRIFIKTIVDVRDKYQTLIQYAFNNDKRFLVALDTACKKIINESAIIGPTHCAKLLAKFSDALLKNSNQNLEETELEDDLNQVIVVFKYIEDKDIFQKLYAKMLAKRLYSKTSISSDTEASMVLKLNQLCGPEFTRNMYKMLEDEIVSKDLNNQYKQHVEQLRDLAKQQTHNEFEFGVLVMCRRYWPLKQFVQSPCLLPIDLEQSVSRFTNFYKEKHPSRKLNWCYNLSIGELLANYFKNRYTLLANTFQMIILLQFNEQQSWSIQQLKQNTGIVQEILIQTLQTLLRMKLLNTNDDAANLQPDSTVILNENFANKKRRININVPTKTEEHQEKEDEAAQQLDERERMVLTQTAIVKIMKQHKTLSQANLVGEVLNQLSTRFKPTIKMIKQCIGFLIEREYLERQDGQKDVYNYLN